MRENVVITAPATCTPSVHDQEPVETTQDGETWDNNITSSTPKPLTTSQKQMLELHSERILDKQNDYIFEVFKNANMVLLSLETAIDLGKNGNTHGDYLP